jgi:uncharacterized protein involved in outer membrane biogenesis
MCHALRMSPPPPATRPLLPRSIAARVALGALAVLAVLACTFDWNWCRPLIHHYVMARSGRDIRFDDLRVHWRDGLDPTIEFRGLVVQNAPWAASREPLVRAGRLAATLSWRSLGSDMTVVNFIELDDAQLDMERLADGLRNWRITRPDDRGPPRVRVLALDARRSRLHLIHRGIGLELVAQTTPLAGPEVLAGHADLPLTKRLAVSGNVDGHAFEADTRVSDVLTFGATPRRFAVRGTARLGSLTLAAAGLSDDVHALGDLDLDATLAADGADAPWPLPEALARARPLAARGHVTRAGDRWTAEALHLSAGHHTALVADATFTGSWKSDTPRRTLRATLRDARIDLDDLWPPRTRNGAGPTLSTTPLPLARLRDLDADIDLRPARVVDAGHAFVQSVRAHALLANGALRVEPLDIVLADGHVDGTLALDAARTPATLAADLQARGLRVEQLSPRLAANGALAGALDGRASLRTRGDSARELVAAAGGSLTLSLAGGATVSRRIDAKLGLNGGEWLRTLFDKSARVPLQCAQATLALAHGVATPRRFVFETPDTALAAQGSVDLAGETVDATLTPARKKLALLALDKSIHAEGPWNDVKISLRPPAQVEPERCGS